MIPWGKNFLKWVIKPEAFIFRIPLAILFMLGGLISFLPILGIWMFSLGLILLAIDIVVLRVPLARFLIRVHRLFQKIIRKIKLKWSEINGW